MTRPSQPPAGRCGKSGRRTRKDIEWPLTMAQAAHIARIPDHDGSDEAIAAEYGVPVSLVHDLRSGKGYKGVNMPVCRP